MTAAENCSENCLVIAPPGLNLQRRRSGALLTTCAAPSAVVCRRALPLCSRSSLKLCDSLAAARPLMALGNHSVPIGCGSSGDSACQELSHGLPRPMKWSTILRDSSSPGTTGRVFDQTTEPPPEPYNRVYWSSCYDPFPSHTLARSSVMAMAFLGVIAVRGGCCPQRRSSILVIFNNSLQRLSYPIAGVEEQALPRPTIASVDGNHRGQLCPQRTSGRNV